MKKITLFTMMLLAIFSVNAQLGTYQFQEAASASFSSFPGMTNVFSGGDFDTEDAPNISIGFDFKYAGQTYNTITISVDGAISFSESNIFGGNDLSSISSNHTFIVAPFWDDLKLFASDNGHISYKTYGTAPNRGFVVEWVNIRRYNHTGTASFRLFLKETTNYIKFQYGTSTLTSSDASIGFSSIYSSNAQFVSVTPGSPSTISTSTANNTVSHTAFPANKLYTFSPRPENDMFQNAIPITLNDCGNPITAYNAGATPSGGTAPSCGGYPGSPIRDIWYSFVAPQRGAVKFSRKNEGDWSSISYAIHHGTDMDDPIVDCNWINIANTSRNIYNLIPGDTYLIRMWDYDNDDFGYAYFCMESLDNDANSNGFSLVVQPENATSYVETYANNVGATESPNPPTVWDFQGGDVWFKFTAPSNGQLAVVHSDIEGDWSSFAFAIYENYTQPQVADNIIYLQGSSHNPPYEVKVISGLTPGTLYYLRAWDYGNDNFGNSPFYLREDTTSGIEDYTSLDFNYYPNPATNMLNVTAKDDITAITLTNMMGQQVMNITPNSQEAKLNIAHLPQGIYIMSVIMSGDNSKTVKIIKK